VNLSSREIAVLRHPSEGSNAQLIADILNVSEPRLRTYMQRVQKKLKANTQAHVVALALQRRLI